MSGQTELFDKHEKPDLAGYTDADLAWSACEDYEGYVYNVADSLSEGEWDRMISDVRVLYDEYYARFES